MPSYAASMTTLSYVFFVIAGVWLIAALLYSLLVLCFLRLRARGELGNLEDEDFGRIHLCGRCYLPMGWIFRRYARHLQLDDNLGMPPRQHSGHFMTKAERRKAIEVLLAKSLKASATSALPKKLLTILRNRASEKDLEPKKTEVDGDLESLASENVPICSICLCEYEKDDVVFAPTTCTHQFHHECIVDWLQLPGRTDCPCCRVPIVDNDEVWRIVKQQRQERKAALKKQKNARGENDNVSGDPQETSETEEMDDSASSFDYSTDEV